MPTPAPNPSPAGDGDAARHLEGPRVGPAELKREIETRLGERFTRQSLWAWATKEGMPHTLEPGAMPGQQVLRYPLAAAIDWIKANKLGGGLSGGKRAGSGRKREKPQHPLLSTIESSPSTPHLTPPTGAEASRAHAVPDSAPSESPPSPPSSPTTPSAESPDLAHLDPEKWLATALRPQDQGGISKSEAERKIRVHEAYQKWLDSRRHAGNLVPLEETLDAWADLLVEFKGLIETAADRLAPRLQAELKLSQVQTQRLQQELLAWSAGVLESLAAAPATAVAKAG